MSSVVPARPKDEQVSDDPTRGRLFFSSYPSQSGGVDSSSSPKPLGVRFPDLVQSRSGGAVARCPLSRDKRTLPRGVVKSLATRSPADRPHCYSQVFFLLGGHFGGELANFSSGSQPAAQENHCDLGHLQACPSQLCVSRYRQLSIYFQSAHSQSSTHSHS